MLLISSIQLKKSSNQSQTNSKTNSKTHARTHAKTHSRLHARLHSKVKALSELTQTPGPAQGCIWLYDACGYASPPVEICSPNPNFVSEGFNFDNMASGIKLGPNTRATLYIDPNYSGSQYTFDSDVACFSNSSDTVLATFNNSASSVNIISPNQQNSAIDSPREGCVWLYDGCNYTRRAVEFCSSNDDFRSSPYNFKSLASSIKLGPNTYTTLYTRLKQTGSSATFLTNNSCFTTDNNPDVKNVDNQTTSLYIWTQPNQGCAWLYQDCNFGGKRVTVCQNYNELDSLTPPFSNTISSARLGPNTQLTISQGKDFTGEKIALSSDNNCFATDPSQRVRDIDNQSNSLQVFTVSPNTDTPPDGCIYLYQDCNYSARKVAFCGDDNNLVDNNFNDLASAIRLGAGVTVQLFDGAGYTGKSTTVTSDRACFATDESQDLRDLNNLVSSLKVIKQGKKPCIHSHQP
jgi:hypothetical protein